MLPWDIVGVVKFVIDIRFDMLDSNSNGDGVEITVVEGMEVVWVGVVRTDCAVSFGFVEAIDLGFDTMKDLKLNRVYNNGEKTRTNKWERGRERERDFWRELNWNVFPQLNQYNHQDRLYSIITWR